MKKYKIGMYFGEKLNLIETIEVEAEDIEQAREKAWDLFSLDVYAEEIEEGE